MWIDGLDRIHGARGIIACVDMSATPFYIQGSGHPEGTPFPWLVSDFGLVDAIESGIVTGRGAAESTIPLVRRGLFPVVYCGLISRRAAPRGPDGSDGPEG